MSFFLVCSLVALGKPKPLVDLSELGIYDRGFALYQQGDNVIACHPMSGTLLLLDKKWQLLTRFEAVGPGPGEIERPVVFGVTAHSALLLNRFKDFLELDGSLSPTGRTFPPFPATDVVRGRARGDGSFILVGTGTGTHLVWEVHLKNGRWERGKALFPKTDANAIFNRKILQHHQDLCFTILSPFRDYLPGEPMENLHNPDRYEVEVYDLGQGLQENLVQVLSHTIDGLPEFESHIMFLAAAFKLGGRYYLHLNFIKLPGEEEVGYLDTFAEDGSFLGRKLVGPHWRYLPIRGSDRIVQLNSDTMELFTFEPER